jgi:cold shock CspA family protein/tetratricopeptide (TPR) repeat protein
MSDRQAKQVFDSLRGSPLAIRWFVEAVQAGGQPDALLRDQSAVLQFCMSSIYDSLSANARTIVDALVELDRSASVGQLALLTDLERDEVLEEVYELQRRAIVQVDSRLSETLSQSYSLSSMAGEYLRRFGPSGGDAKKRIQAQLKEIAATEELIRRYNNAVALEPMAIAAETPEERAVANLLRNALRKSKRGDLDAARADVAKARDAVPAYFETYRVGAFIESDARPEEARRLYQEAYRLAPETGKAKVAYWLAGHLLNLRSAEEAERYAREAHEALGLPGTAIRVARVCMYEGQRYDEAESLLEVGAASENTKTRMIAETLLLDLGKRRTELLAQDEKQPVAAFQAALQAVKRGENVVRSGIVDPRYEEGLVAVVTEAFRAANGVPDLQLIEEELAELLEAIDRGFRLFARPGVRDQWTSRLGRLCARSDCPEDLLSYAQKLEKRLERQIVLARAGRLSGVVLEFSAKKGFGIIRPDEGESNVFFHRTSVPDPEERLLLTRGSTVTYSPEKKSPGGDTRPRAENVHVVAAETDRARALRERRGRVVHRDTVYVFAEDVATQERIYVHRSAFVDHADWLSATDGTVITMDLELNDRGPKAVQKTACLNRDSG